MECKKSISESDGNSMLLISCDVCKQDYCSSCFNLSASVHRVLPLKNLMLVICCLKRKPVVLQSLLNDEKARHLEQENTLL